jgi:hypothetical protein
VPYLVFASALWAAALSGLAVHISDVCNRYAIGVMTLRQFERTRPLDWLLAGTFLFAAAAAVLVALDGPALWTQDERVAGKLHLAIAAVIVAVALVYVGTRGATRAVWVKDRFIDMPGATVTTGTEVRINVRMEAEMDAAAIRRFAWPAYLGVTIVALIICTQIPEIKMVAPLALIPASGGAGLVNLMLTRLPQIVSEEDW